MTSSSDEIKEAISLLERAYANLGDLALELDEILKQIDPVPLVISDIAAVSGLDYQVSALNEGQRVYIDRDYTLSTVPTALAGNQFIRTANSDKSATNNPFLSFTVNTNCRVRVAWDRGEPLPGWIDGSWLDTGESIVTSDAELKCYLREYSAGTVYLGAAGLGSAGSNYIVVVSLAG